MPLVILFRLYMIMLVNMILLYMLTIQEVDVLIQFKETVH